MRGLMSIFGSSWAVLRLTLTIFEGTADCSGLLFFLSLLLLSRELVRVVGESELVREEELLMFGSSSSLLSNHDDKLDSIF